MSSKTDLWAGQEAPFFTVFTPTYNRAHTLHRVFNSLKAQSFRDFEWVLVDDGSTDNTEELAELWIKTADFPIRYFWQKNSGKHIAYNFGIREARGQMFAVLDSDDALVPNALSRIFDLWHQIPESDRSGFCLIAGLCCDQHGVTIPSPFPSSPLDTTAQESAFVHRIRGEKFAVRRTEIWRRYPFPEITGTNYIPEVLVALQIGEAYKFRLVNEVLRVYYVEDDPHNLSSRSNVAMGARGRLCYNVWLLNHEMRYFWRSPIPFIKAAAMLPVVNRYAGRSLREFWRELDTWSARLLVLAMYPLAIALTLFHSLRIAQGTARAGEGTS
ncbi:MAG TPA: glycosyltransferase family A protein [Xanthobacteraceae bacterium]|jgi:glycosyltransferase involved in cell wall biosynthesis|nr:glycosyltransferase family A protein [Xanthobacteraceae bacterium]